jgi:hypothetical protein
MTEVHLRQSNDRFFARPDVRMTEHIRPANVPSWPGLACWVSAGHHPSGVSPVSQNHTLPYEPIISAKWQPPVDCNPRCKVAVQHFDVTLSSTQVNVMEQPRTVITAPIHCADSAVWFSPYGFGWGYRAFALPFELVCEELGARNETAQQCATHVRAEQTPNSEGRPTISSSFCNWGAHNALGCSSSARDARIRLLRSINVDALGRPRLTAIGRKRPRWNGHRPPSGQADAIEGLQDERHQCANVELRHDHLRSGGPR